MSTDTLAPAGEDVARTDGMIRRSFAAEVTAGDGRTVDVRIVPFGERISHNDGLGGVPRGEWYEEEWMPGVFDHQLNAAHRLLANFEQDRKSTRLNSSHHSISYAVFCLKKKKKKK